MTDMNAHVEFRFHEDKDLVSFRWKMERSNRLLRGENSTFSEYNKTISYGLSCKLEELPLAVRGRINMLRVSPDNVYIPKIGSTFGYLNMLRSSSFLITFGETPAKLMAVYVDVEDIEQLLKINPKLCLEGPEYV
jgi:hypothetical protein